MTERTPSALRHAALTDLDALRAGTRTSSAPIGPVGCA